MTLRIQDPFVFDSGKYTCVITTLSGECTSECDVEIEELYEINVLDVIPEFIKAPLPFISLPGCLASFCARITPVDSEVIWSVCGCEISDDMKEFKVSQTCSINLKSFFKFSWIIIVFIYKHLLLYIKHSIGKF